MSVQMKIEYFDPDDLTPYQGNAREHSEHQVQQIIRSILEFGFLNPVIIGKKKLVLAGHGRLMAAKRLKADGKIEKVPGIQVGHLSERQQRAFILADNKIGDNSKWDFTVLSKELNELVEDEFDIDVIGFDEQEIEGLLQEDIDVLPDDFPVDKRKTKQEPEKREDRKKAASKVVHKCPECGCEFSS